MIAKVVACYFSLYLATVVFIAHTELLNAHLFNLEQIVVIHNIK